MTSELEKIGIIHLYTLGYREDDLLSFKLHLNNPSKIAELQELEHWKQKFDIAGAATEGYFSKRWIAENLLGMSEDEFLRNQREMFFDKKYSAKLEAASAGGEAAEGPGGDGGVAGGMSALGGTTDTDTPDTPAGDTGAGETPTGGTGGDEGGESDLLAEPPPAKRDDDIIRPPYIMKKGATTKKMKMSGRPEIGTPRTTHHGAMGSGGMTNLYKQREGIQNDEQKLFSISKEVDDLLESLYKKGEEA